MCCTGSCPCEDPCGSCRIGHRQPYPDDAACNPDAPYLCTDLLPDLAADLFDADEPDEEEEEDAPLVPFPPYNPSHRPC